MTESLREGIHQQDTNHTTGKVTKKLIKFDTLKAMGPNKISPWILQEGAIKIYHKAMDMG